MQRHNIGSMLKLSEKDGCGLVKRDDYYYGYDDDDIDEKSVGYDFSGSYGQAAGYTGAYGQDASGGYGGFAAYATYTEAAGSGEISFMGSDLYGSEREYGYEDLGKADSEMEQLGGYELSPTGYSYGGQSSGYSYGGYGEDYSGYAKSTSGNGLALYTPPSVPASSMDSYSSLDDAIDDLGEIPKALDMMEGLARLDSITEESEDIPELDEVAPEIPEKGRHRRKLKKGVIKYKFRSLTSNKKKMLLASLGTVAAVAVLAFVLMWVGVFDPANGYVMAKEVYFDGYAVGAVDDESALEQIVSSIYSGLSDEYGVEVLDSQLLVMKDTLVDPRYISAPEDIGEAIKKNIDVQISASVIYVDGMAAVALSSKEDAQWVLDKLAEPYAANATEEGTEFVENVEIKTSDISYSMLKSKEDAYTLVAVGSEEEVPYTVQSGDTLQSIASAYGLTVADLQIANANVTTSDDLAAGMSLNLTKPQSIINVGHVEVVTVTSPIAYATTYTEDSSLYITQNRTVQAGVNGEKTSTLEIHYINGEEISRTTISEVVTKEPVNAIIAKGTQKLPTVVQGVSAYGFMWPCQGTITSVFGPRWGSYHYGIDIANSRGTPIRASKSGTVSFAGWSGGYGQLVEINHGDGTSTKYGHNSSIMVSAGQYVTQGEVIALMGSTGQSTGNHCHFEIRINGVAMNPQNYL